MTPNFPRALQHHGLSLRRAPLQELQVNLGYLCNQACEHCHVEAGPKRTEMMGAATMTKVVDWAADNGIRRVDITGGAPELIPGFRGFVDRMRAHDIEVTSRCNLTVLFEPGQEDLAEWYAARRVRLVCSLPCYTPENVEAQRGKGVFGKSIAALVALNAVGYGTGDGDLQLDLVYNPLGPTLPPAQDALQRDYKTRLHGDFGIVFNRLLTIANLPINRFEHYLRRTGQLDDYRQLLADNFNPDTVAPLMCRHLISVDWQGYVYDCDFNQMLQMPMPGGRKQLWQIRRDELDEAPIAVSSHCFGCTAGAGSSCGGALT